MPDDYPAVTCARCEREVPEGEPYWSLDRMHQVMEDGVITVLNAVQISGLCSNCAGEQPSVYDFLREDSPYPRA